MKILSTEGLTKLIQLIKSNFISINDTVTTTTVELADVATSGDYDDLINKPTIPTVNDGTITINQGGVEKGTFTLNQSGNTIIDLDAGGTSSVTWGNVTGILSDQTDLQDALDAKVDKSGDTMTGQLRINRATGSNFVDLLSGMVQRGTKPTSTITLGFMQVSDKNGQWLGKNQFQYTTTGEARMELSARSVTSEALAKLSVGFDSNNNAFASAPATSTTRTNATDIITRGYLNSRGFITGITSSNVTTALGYTPYDSSNPNGYTSNVGTVTSVNNTQPDASGNVTLTIPDTSNLANKDLSNLSSTGNSKFQVPLISGTNIKTINNQSILGGGDLSVSADNIFWATYGTTTYSDMLSAINDNKLVLCTYNGSTYYYDGSGGGYISFTTNTVGTNYVITVDSSDNWTNDNRVLQEQLISSANIKTINNTSLLGSGNITINEPILYSTTGQNTDGAMTQKATTNELNTRIDYSQVAGSHILSAPSGIAEIVNGNLVAKSGLKLLIADGINADGTYNNYIYTLDEDTVLRENYAPSSQSSLYFIQGIWLNNGQMSGFNDIDVSGSQCKNYTHGLYADLPTAGTTTLMYYATDQNKYYCNVPSASTGWFEMKQCFLFYTTNSTIYGYEQIYKPVSPSQIDGVWNNATTTLADGTKIPTSSNLTYDLSSYLPNDKYDYEVLFNGEVTTTATNGSALELRIGSDITRPIRVCGARTRAAANTFGTGNAIIRVGKERTCYVVANSSWTGTFRLQPASYRRLGTNK